jgi:hypothetical protein
VFAVLGKGRLEDAEGGLGKGFSRRGGLLGVLAVCGGAGAENVRV